MKSLPFRTISGSVPVQIPLRSASHRHCSASLALQDSYSGGETSPRTSINTNISRLQLRRCSSEPEFRNSNLRILNKVGSSTSFTAPTVSQECFEESSPAGDRESNRISLSEEFEFHGGGKNKSRISSGCGGGGNWSDVNRGKIHAYYQQMLKLDPTNALLLTNYGKYLHEVEGDFLRAEEYYSRAILSSTNDGELLCLYGNLIWETQRDESRARSYFHRACQASPNNSFVLGSYSHFLWEAEEDEQHDEMGKSNLELETAGIAAEVQAF